MMKTSLLLLALLITLSLKASGQNTNEPPLITVSGQAEIAVVPDEVAFSLRATTIDKDLLTAQTKNDAVVKRVFALAQSYNIPPERIQTDYIKLDERYSDEEVTKKPSVLLGYVVTKNISILLRDVTKAEHLLADIFKSGITHIDSVDFRCTQVRKYKDQARAMAIRAAQEKASALAREIGQSIGKAYSICEDCSNNNLSLGNLNMNSNGTANYSRAPLASGTYSESEGTIALGQISITARVVVRFELK